MGIERLACEALWSLSKGRSLLRKLGWISVDVLLAARLDLISSFDIAALSTLKTGKTRKFYAP